MITPVTLVIALATVTSIVLMIKVEHTSNSDTLTPMASPGPV
jgi:hypothetical protein